MALTFDTTTGGAAATSYCTVEAADSYHAHHLHGDTWKEAELWKKQAGLVWATRLLNEQVLWNGAKATTAQRLPWPRTDVVDKEGEVLDYETIPEWLQEATAELARYLIGEDRTTERGYGITRVKADVVEVEFDSADERPVLPASVRSMVGFYGSIQGGAQGWIPLARV